MTTSMLPDEYLGSNDNLRRAVAADIGIAEHDQGHMVVLVEHLDGDGGWDVASCCQPLTDQLADLFQAQADQLRARRRRLAN